MSFLDECIAYAKKRKPRTQYQKRETITVKWNGLETYHFPPKPGDGFIDAPRLPDNISKLKLNDIEPNERIIDELYDLFKYTKKTDVSPITHFLCIYECVYLLGYDCTKEMVYLVKSGKGTFGVDRMGRCVFFKVRV